jgi:hypothetical protein
MIEKFTEIRKDLFSVGTLDEETQHLTTEHLNAAIVSISEQPEEIIDGEYLGEIVLNNSEIGEEF